MSQFIFTEDELSQMLHVSLRRIEDLRKMGVLKGVKTGKYYVYHINEINELFDKYKGSRLPSTN